MKYEADHSGGGDFGHDVFALNEELRQLRRENEWKEEQAILHKTPPYFAKGSVCSKRLSRAMLVSGMCGGFVRCLGFRGADSTAGETGRCANGSARIGGCWWRSARATAPAVTPGSCAEVPRTLPK